MSTASGIPSFRGEDGIWHDWDPASFHRRRLDADPAGFWRDRIELRADMYGEIDPEPNAAHRALASLEADGYLDAVLTQNVDGLHGTRTLRTCFEIGRASCRERVYTQV